MDRQGFPGILLCPTPHKVSTSGESLMRKLLTVILSVIIVLVILGVSSQNIPAHAQGGSDGDFAVSVDITGVIQSITQKALTFTDNTTFKITAETKGISPDL